MTNVLLISLAPVIVILLYVYFRDKYEKEPLGLLFVSLVVGGLIVIPIVIAERFLMGLNPFFEPVSRAAYTSFIVAGLTEELFKFAAVILLIWKNKNFNQRYDGIVYAVFVGLGFAGVENIFYVSEYGNSLALSRAFTAVPAHAILGIVMGYYLGMARFSKTKSKIYIIKAISIPVFLHGLYDFLILSELPLLMLLLLPYLAYLYGSGLRKIKALNMMKDKYFDAKHNPYNHT